MKIELKNIKFSLSFSHETLCYTANVYVNGKKEGFVENNGWGGSSNVLIKDKDLLEELNQYFLDKPAYTATLPNGQKLENFKDTLDIFLDELAEKHVQRKEQEKLIKKEQKIKTDFNKKGFPVTLKVVKHNHFLYVGVKSEDQKLKIAEKHVVSEDKVSTV